jgi:hypothetical protein
MAIATTASTETVRKDLKTCPPDGYVVIRRQTYGEKLNNSESTMKLTAGAKKSSGLEGEVALVNKAVTIWQFANLIVDHNLEHQAPNGDLRLLNFKQISDIQLLRGDIGEEIATYIDELNNFEATDEEGDAQGNSSGASAPSSS